MKKINSILAGLLLTASLFFSQQATAQAPQKMSYQSVIRNSSNVLLAGTQVGIRISVLQGSATGTAVYVETQTATTNGNGLVSIQIGNASFAAINWAAGSYFIKTETDPAGGTNYTITGTQQILSVPYAMYAAKSGDSTKMGAVGGSSSTNGATITSGVLSLTPADAANGGIVTTGAQTIAGNKTLTGTLGVGTATPAAAAQLHVSSTTKGLLPPRMTAAQRNAIATSPSVAGLTVWCTNCGTSGQMQVFNGTVWTDMAGAAAAPGIGDSYQGGIVAYILVPGDPGYNANIQHGLIAATSDQGSGIEWLLNKYLIGGTGTAIGTGLSNTNIIITSWGTSSVIYAAKLARAYTGGGYTDWYLPSKDEINKLCLNQDVVGGFAATTYWSSTEFGSDDAWSHRFGNSNFPVQLSKYWPNRVRAVRSF